MNSTPPTVPGHRVSAPYGQACLNCSKAKCKCVSARSPSGPGPNTPCDRCLRLGKECRPSTTLRRRTTRRPAAGTSRTAQLEEKLEDLVSILRAHTQAQTPGGVDISGPADAPRTVGPGEVSNVGGGQKDVDGSLVFRMPANEGPESKEDTRPPPHSLNNGKVLTPAESVANSHGYAPSTVCSTPASLSSAPTSSLEAPMTPAQAGEMLDMFREHHLRFFPFVYIPLETSAEQLQREKPFLWLNIRALCCKSPSQQAALGRRAREILAQRMLIDLERNLDTLLGLLAYLEHLAKDYGSTNIYIRAMYQFNGKPYIIAMANMAIALVADLRLDRPIQENPNKEVHCFKSYYFPTCQAPAGSKRTNEETRAVLACFIFCSSISSFLKCQPMRWTAHMEDSLQELAAHPECPGDELLVTIIKTYKIFEDVAIVTTRSTDNLSIGSPRPPPILYVKALREKLEQIKTDLPASLVGSKIVLSYLIFTELVIADMPLWHHGSTSTATTSTCSSFAPAQPGRCAGNLSMNIDHAKIESYHACLSASKACLENFLSLPASQYVGLSFPPLLHFSRATQVLYRLLMTVDPDWDRELVRSNIDLLAVMEQTAANYRQAALIHGMGDEGPESLSFYAKTENALKATVPFWRDQVEKTGFSMSPGGAAAGAADGVGAGEMGGPGAMPQQCEQMPSAVGTQELIDFSDDAWLTDILRSWDT